MRGTIFFSSQNDETPSKYATRSKYDMRTDKRWGGRSTFFSKVVRVQTVILPFPQDLVEEEHLRGKKQAIKSFKDLSGIEQTKEGLLTHEPLLRDFVPRTSFRGPAIKITGYHDRQ